MTLEIILAFNTFVVLGVGYIVVGYVVKVERRLTIIEKHLSLIDKQGL